LVRRGGTDTHSNSGKASAKKGKPQKKTENCGGVQKKIIITTKAKKDQAKKRGIWMDDNRGKKTERQNKSFTQEKKRNNLSSEWGRRGEVRGS